MRPYEAQDSSSHCSTAGPAEAMLTSRSPLFLPGPCVLLTFPRTLGIWGCLSLLSYTCIVFLPTFLRDELYNIKLCIR